METILKEKKAVIFDMDGVLVNSEPFWKQAEYEVFSELGVLITDEWSFFTQSMTTKEVTEFWFQKYPWNDKPLQDVELSVMYRVMELISNSDCCNPGIQSFIEALKKRNLKIGLATNSPEIIIPVVLKKTNTAHLFDVISSADAEAKGKPDPAIYLTTARKLKVNPEDCLVIEDSRSGIVAGKREGMTVIVYSNNCTNYFSEIADYILHRFEVL
jgi:sugar-phosphatase